MSSTECTPETEEGPLSSEAASETPKGSQSSGSTDLTSAPEVFQTTTTPTSSEPSSSPGKQQKTLRANVKRLRRMLPKMDEILQELDLADLWVLAILTKQEGAARYRRALDEKEAAITERDALLARFHEIYS